MLSKWADAIDLGGRDKDARLLGNRELKVVNSVTRLKAAWSHQPASLTRTLRCIQNICMKPIDSRKDT